MLIHTTSSRRRFLTGLGSAAAALPLLPAFQSHAAPGDVAKRLLLFYTPNGTRLQHWRPSGSERNFELSTILAPLESFKSKLLVLDGIDNQAIYSGPGNGHQATGCLWTGTELMEGDLFTEGDNMPSGWAGGVSVDQYVADQLEGQTPFRSLELGVNYYDHSAQLRTRMSYRGAGEPVPPDGDPRNVFERLFADALLDDDELARYTANRLSIIDGVKDELGRINAKLGAPDRAKLEAHLEHIRSIERRLEDGLAACAVPEIGDPGGYSSSNFPIHGDLQIDLLVAALACDRTRVGSLFWMQETAGPTFDWLGHSTPHHELSHQDTQSDSADYVQIQVWMAQKFARLLEKLDAVPEGDGTMLDNTVVVWGSPIGNSWSHSCRNVPIVMAGSCGGYFDTGRYLRWGSMDATSGSSSEHGGRTNNDLLISLCHAMDAPVETFGNPQLCTGPIDALT